MKQHAIRQTATEVRNQSAQGLINEKATIELSDEELAQVTGAGSHSSRWGGGWGGGWGRGWGGGWGGWGGGWGNGWGGGWGGWW
jgi:hypothetical protein